MRLGSIQSQAATVVAACTDSCPAEQAHIQGTVGHTQLGAGEVTVHVDHADALDEQGRVFTHSLGSHTQIDWSLVDAVLPQNNVDRVFDHHILIGRIVAINFVCVSVIQSRIGVVAVHQRSRCHKASPIERAALAQDNGVVACTFDHQLVIPAKQVWICKPTRSRKGACTDAINHQSLLSRRRHVNEFKTTDFVYGETT